MAESGLTVVLVEDDPAVRLGCEQALELEGYATLAFDNAEAARAALCTDFPGIVVSDVRLPGMDGLALLNALHALDPQLPVVLITGHGDINMAVQAMKDGAYHFLEKPFAPEQLVDVVQRALEKRALTLEVKALRQRLAGQVDIAQRLIGRSPAMVELRRLISDLADTDADVLIHGETGSGKELVARCLHDLSRRRKGHFVALNCGGLPESVFESELFGHEAGAFTGAQKQRIGKIEYASGGTLFLDEIETMPMLLQIKLLRVFQERVVERLGANRPIPVDCRVLAATKADLREQADAGRFRADLYYRLNVVSLEIPPLRERREDIPLLFEHFVEDAARRYQREAPEIGEAVRRQLVTHNWPGNVRELRNAADRYVLGLKRDVVGRPAAEADELPLAKAVELFESTLIAEALRRHDHNLTRTAQALQVAKTTLHDKLKKYGLKCEG
jgi:two-component system C4-dicarboxylate transport response regulator DctD